MRLLRSDQVLRGAEGYKVKNPDDGSKPSAAGLPDGSGESATGLRDGSGGKKSRGTPHEDASNTPNARIPSRKRRRKRRRGRRVFARDTHPGDSANNNNKGAQESGNGNKARTGEGNQQQRSRSRNGHQRNSHTRPYGPAYAALDLGTNNCRLLVAVPTRPGQFRVVDAFSRIVRLGEGLSRTGALSQGAMDRAVEALKVCADKLGSRTLRRKRMIATEACRSAENGEVFLNRVKAETGLDLEIVNRETEARLAVSGCGPLVERHTKAVVLFDIGGGSSEIALVDASRKRSPRLSDHIVSWTSLPVGVVSLAERHGGRDVTPESFSDMIADVRAMLDKFEDANLLAEHTTGEGFHLLGTSGTVTTLAGIHLGLERYDRRRVDGIWLTSDEIDTTTERLLGWSYEDRVANACIGADRADLVLAGCAILEAIRAKWPSQRLRVADRGLREGILTEMMSADGVWRRRYRRGAGRRPQ